MKWMSGTWLPRTWLREHWRLPGLFSEHSPKAQAGPQDFSNLGFRVSKHIWNKNVCDLCVRFHRHNQGVVCSAPSLSRHSTGCQSTGAGSCNGAIVDWWRDLNNMSRGIDIVSKLFLCVGECPNSKDRWYEHAYVCCYKKKVPAGEIHWPSAEGDKLSPKTGENGAPLHELCPAERTAIWGRAAAQRQRSHLAKNIEVAKKIARVCESKPPFLADSSFKTQ